MSSAGIRRPWTAEERRLLASGQAIVEVRYSGDGLTHTERVLLCSTFPAYTASVIGCADEKMLPRSPRGVKISRRLARQKGLIDA